MAACSMLLVSTLMLSSASYAWFSISTAPEISGLTTTVATNETLEIALSKGAAFPGESDVTDGAGDDAQYKWGNIINLDATDGGDAGTAYASLIKTLRPMQNVQTAGTDGSQDGTRNYNWVTGETYAGTLMYPLYNTEGRIDSLSGVTALVQEEDTSSVGTGFGNIVDDEGNIYGYYVDYWLRSNETGNVLLTPAVDRAADGSTLESGEVADSTVMGSGSFFTAGVEGTETDTDASDALAANIRIAFKDLATADTEGTVTAIDSYSASSDVTTVTATEVETVVATSGDNTSTFKEGTIVTYLTKDVAKLVRMYVYLEGDGYTNQFATTSDETVEGFLNVQFKMAEIADGISLNVDSGN